MTYNEFAAAGNAYRKKQAEAAEVEAQRQAERAGDDIVRLLSTLDDKGIAAFRAAFSKEPTAAQRIQSVKTGSEQQAAQTTQSQLEAEYRAELGNKRGTAAMLVRAKYRGLGLNI